MSTAPIKDEQARAADRLTMDYRVPILASSTTNATVHGNPSNRPSTDAERRAARDNSDEDQ